MRLTFFLGVSHACTTTMKQDKIQSTKEKHACIDFGAIMWYFVLPLSFPNTGAVSTHGFWSVRLRVVTCVHHLAFSPRSLDPSHCFVFPNAGGRHPGHPGEVSGAGEGHRGGGEGVAHHGPPAQKEADRTAGCQNSGAIVESLQAGDANVSNGRIFISI